MHHRDESCNSGTAILSFLTGTVIGASIALLVAPRSGRETREMLAEYGIDVKDRTMGEINDRRENLTERGKELIESGRELIQRGTEMVHQGRDYLDDKKKALSTAIEAGREAMQQEKQNLAESYSEEE